MIQVKTVTKLTGSKTDNPFSVSHFFMYFPLKITKIFRYRLAVVFKICLKYTVPAVHSASGTRCYNLVATAIIWRICPRTGLPELTLKCAAGHSLTLLRIRNFTGFYQFLTPL